MTVTIELCRSLSEFTKVGGDGLLYDLFRRADDVFYGYSPYREFLL